MPGTCTGSQWAGHFGRGTHLVCQANTQREQALIILPLPGYKLTSHLYVGCVVHQQLISLVPTNVFSSQ